MVDTVPDMPALGVAEAEGLERPDGRIEFEGLPNTRDLGGIEGAEGRRISRGRLIRSGELASATEHDLEALVGDYDLRTVIDLRTEQERREKPDPQDSLVGVRFVDAPVLGASTIGITREGGIKGALKMLRQVQEDPAKVMEDIYPSMILAEDSQRGFALFFDEVLATPDGAVLWHCTAGKDRAGLAAALLLQALGAPRDAIMADYLLTNRYMQSRSQEILDALAAYHLADKLDGSIHVINSADPRFLQAAFDAAEREYGSLDAYLERAVGVTPDKRDQLRARYLE